MRKNGFNLIVGCIMLLVLVLSACKSAPPAATPDASAEKPAPVATSEPAPAPTPPAVTESKPIDEALTALHDKAENLRNEGLKYGLDTYKADDWNKAESSWKAGNDAYGTDYDLAKTSFEDAIAQYEKIRQSSFDSISAELEDAIIKAREAAIRVGARAYYPVQFAKADEAVDQAIALRDEKDLPGAYEAGQIALMRFQILQDGMFVLEQKQKIDQNKFEQYAPNEYRQAYDKYYAAAADYGVADTAALESSHEAVRLSIIVVNAGFKVWAEDLVPKVDDVRTLCDSIKARKAAKDESAKADAMYDAAYAYAADEDWESAYYAGSDALSAYTDIFQEVTLKKNAADVAIAAAKNQQAASTELALRADELAPLAEGTEGYSEELPVIDESTAGEETK